MDNPYNLTIEQVINELKTDKENGLSNEVAKERFDKYGENTLTEYKRKSILSLFFSQFKDLMIIILLIAAAISFFISLIEKEGYFEPLLILGIVIINAIIGLVQEGKAEKSMEALRKMTVQRARVIRSGQEMVIDAKELTLGDIIKLEAGDFIPADARLVSSSNLKSLESALTGESSSVDKNPNQITRKDLGIGASTNKVNSCCSI